MSLRQRYTPMTGTTTVRASTIGSYTYPSASAFGPAFSRTKNPPTSSVTPLLPPMHSASGHDGNVPPSWTSFANKNVTSNPSTREESSSLDRKKSASTSAGCNKIAVATVVPTFCELPKDDDPSKVSGGGATKIAAVATNSRNPKTQEASSSSGSSSRRDPSNEQPQQRSTPIVTAVRSRIEERLQKALQEASLTRHRSPELVPLSAEYEELQKNLRIMVTAVTNYADSTQRMNRARDAIAHQLGVLSRHSPLYGQLGRSMEHPITPNHPKENEPQPVLALPTHLSEEERRKFVEGDLIVGEVATAKVVAADGRPPTIWEEEAEDGEEKETKKDVRSGGKQREKGRFFGGSSAATAANVRASVTTAMAAEKAGFHPDSPSSLLTRLATPPKSLAEVQTMASLRATENQRELDQHVVRWTLEWRDTVTEWVDRKKKEVRKLQKDKDHYESKVELLRRRCHHHEPLADSCSSRGATTSAVVGTPSTSSRTASPAQIEKLERNEKKLKEAFLRYETEAARLCALLEAVTRDGWIELYNLSRNYMKWESNRVKRETDVYSHLGVTLELLKITQKRSLSLWNRRKSDKLQAQLY